MVASDPVPAEQPGAPLTRDGLRTLLGPLDPRPPLQPRVEEESVQDGYLRRLVSYRVPAGRISAFVCSPHPIPGPTSAVFCHHQHNGEFDLGKSEVVGLRGAADLGYAAELARRGFVTIAPDAIGFEDRNPVGSAGLGWFELSSRLVRSRTLLASCLDEISAAIDLVTALPEVAAEGVGFIGHSYGGRAALWAPAWDERIAASVSNCGCIPFRESFTPDTGFQPEYTVPGFALDYDIEDVVAIGRQCRYLIIGTEEDRWSRGVAGVRDGLEQLGCDHARVQIEPGGHAFPAPTRETAYRFLSAELTGAR